MANNLCGAYLAPGFLFALGMDEMTLNRRNFITNALSSGVGIAAFSGVNSLARLVEASVTPASEMHYIFCYFSGAWDVLLGLDPRDHTIFTTANRGLTQIEPGYDLLELPGEPIIEPVSGMKLGPFIGGLAEHAHRMTVVRGMSMETLTHQTGRRRFLTGRAPSGINARGSSTDTWLAAHLGQGYPIPNLALNMESYNKEHPAFASALRANSVSDLTRALNPAIPIMDSNQAAQLDDLLKTAALCPRAMNSPLWQSAEANRINANALVARQLGGLFDFQGSALGMAELRSHYGIPQSGTVNGSLSAAAMAATAIKNGISRCVSVRIANSLDTHFSNWQTEHGERLKEGFDAVAKLVEDLAASPYKDTTDSWLDHTVIIGFSEFSRTPLLNANGGRDHWLMNACFLLGGNIKGGQVIGASSDVGMHPQSVNLQTGELLSTANGGEVVRPEHILQALYEDIGLTSEPDLRVAPLSAIFA